MHKITGVVKRKRILCKTHLYYALRYLCELKKFTGGTVALFSSSDIYSHCAMTYVVGDSVKLPPLHD